MKKILNNKAEGYIDICVGIIALLSVLVLTLNVYSFFTLKQDLDEISEQLIETATYNGCFGDEFNERAEQLKSQLFDFDVETSADNFYNASYKRVQLGNTMKVTVKVHTKIMGIGIVNIPVTCTSTRSGISEHYWKG
ncbi:MAG: DUF4320 family protein [Faecalibacterium sp.]|nr:DUF4320 family protein [Ruminococcus sp.]MCM1391709.1 DUF4320 family protein [Ruminococcus sp.]MCM1486137.1 DUF4320 family protein [Faecalibacterium sp.]